MKSVLTKGTFKFDPEFWDKENDLIVRYFNSAEFNEDNGIKNVVDQGCGEFRFSTVTDHGIGMILPYVFVPINPNEPIEIPKNDIETVGDAFKKLFKDGTNEESIITFDYKEYQHNDRNYTHITAEIKPTSGFKFTNYFEVVKFHKESLPATERMLVDNDIEEGINVYNDDLMSFNALRDVYLRLTMIVNTNPKYKPSKIVDMHHKFVKFLEEHSEYDGGFLRKHYLNQTELAHWLKDSGLGKQFEK